MELCPLAQSCCYKSHWKLPPKSWDQGPNSRGQHPLRRQCSTRNLVHDGRTCCPPSALRRSLCRDSSPGQRERVSQLSGVGLALHLRTESDRDLGHDPALCVGHRASVPEGPAPILDDHDASWARGPGRWQFLHVDVSRAPGLDVDASAGQAPAGSTARLRRLVDLRLRSAYAGGVLGDLALRSRYSLSPARRGTTHHLWGGSPTACTSGACNCSSFSWSSTCGGSSGWPLGAAVER